MNKTFLEYVAEDLLNKYGNDLSRIKVVFPNKRASLFLNDYLVRQSHQPIWSPTYLTISQLFRDNSDLTVGDDIQLICYLHRIYQECTGISETLDHFYGWGQLMLSDFDDIDKNMADATDVFKNLSNIHELDDVSYLTDEQKEVLKKFFHYFSDDYNTELKKRFLKLWQNVGKIYQQYNDFLFSKGLAYEGALYREVVSREDIKMDADCYVFIGFNMLQKVEQTLFKRLRKEGKAKFYWDFDKYYLNNDANEAGHYIRQYLSLFPNELDSKNPDIYDRFSESKDIAYISASTETMQARYIAHWLMQNNRYAAGRKTAVVLCDENLLHTAIYSLPSELEHVNITSGFPLMQSPVYAFVNSLIKLQTMGCVKNTDKWRLRNVAEVLRHPYMQHLSDESQTLVAELERLHIYYPASGILHRDENLKMVFEHQGVKAESQQDYNRLLISWLLDLLKLLGISVNAHDDVLMKESVFKMYTLLNRLHELIVTNDLVVDLVTLQRLITQLIQQTTIPFHGEPASGVQLMGVLETRNLDFDNILILSCNEGNMPKGVKDSSFIPYSIRKAFELTTIDHKVAIYSYYFHRMLQRAKNITILYNNSRKEGQTSEMSRLMMQLMVEGNHIIRREAIQAGQTTTYTRPKAIEKTPAMMDYLKHLEKLSPTAINRYLRCPLQFYYYTVAGLKEKDNDADEMDQRTFGNIFHRSSQLIYERIQTPDKLVTAEAIRAFRLSKIELEKVVDQAFREELFKVDEGSYHPEYNGLQLITRKVIMTYLTQLLEIDEQLAPFRMLGMEEEVTADMEFQVKDAVHTLKIGGYVDRLDEVLSKDQPHIRVVDYKTGHSTGSKIQSLEEVFQEEHVVTKHSDYYFQTFLYTAIIRQSKLWNKEGRAVSPALLFIQKASDKEYDPTLLLGKERVDDIQTLEADFWEHLKQLLEEIFNEDIAFNPTADSKRCTFCPYAKVCQR